MGVSRLRVIQNAMFKVTTLKYIIDLISFNLFAIFKDKTARPGKDGTLLPMMELKGEWEEYKLALAPARGDPEALKILEDKPENKARRRKLRDLVKNYGRTRKGQDIMRRKREAEKATGPSGYRSG